MKRLLCLLAIALPAIAEDAGFFILKTGERFATQEKAGDVLRDFGATVARRLGRETLPGRITNDPETALEALRAARPLFAIVPPAFLLQYGKELGMIPILQTRRLGFATEKFAIVMHKGATWDGGQVATALVADEVYLRRVVLPADMAAKVQFVASPWVGDDIAAMAERDPSAPLAVLLDRPTTEFFRGDDLTWPELQVVFESDELPPDVVVAFSSQPDDDREALRKVLEAMTRDEEGKAVCEVMQTDGFGPLDEALWARARERWEK